MAKQEMLRTLIREILKQRDVELSMQAVRSDTQYGGAGKSVRVALNGKTWLTSSQAEIDRVIAAGGKVIK